MERPRGVFSISVTWLGLGLLAAFVGIASLYLPQLLSELKRHPDILPPELAQTIPEEFFFTVFGTLHILFGLISAVAGACLYLGRNWARLVLLLLCSLFFVLSAASVAIPFGWPPERGLMIGSVLLDPADILFANLVLFFIAALPLYSMIRLLSSKAITRYCMRI